MPETHELIVFQGAEVYIDYLAGNGNITAAVTYVPPGKLMNVKFKLKVTAATRCFIYCVDQCGLGSFSAKVEGTELVDGVEVPTVWLEESTPDCNVIYEGNTPNLPHLVTVEFAKRLPLDAGAYWITFDLVLTYTYEPPAPQGVLRVESSPTGKTGQMTYLGETFPFTTPSEVTLGVGTEVVVSIDPVDFAYWHDDNTNPVRTEIIEIRKTIKAFYVGVVPAKLTCLSLDEKGNSFPGQNAVQLIYMGIEQYLDVPFSYRLTKGTYTLVAVPPEDRTFSFWRKPDGSTTEEQYITFDLQEDTQVEVHWIKKRVGIGIPIWVLVGLIFIPLAYIVLKGD